MDFRLVRIKFFVLNFSKKGNMIEILGIFRIYTERGLDELSICELDSDIFFFIFIFG